MKLWGKFFLAVLTLSLLSYGVSGAAFAAAEPISVITNKEFYVEGATITISGLVKDFDTSDDMRSMDVTLMVIAPNGNLVDIGQVTPDEDGNYSTTFSTGSGGMINAEGDYTVKVKWGAQANQTIFEFGGSTGTAPPEPEEQEPTIIETIDEEPDEEPEEEPAMTQPICGPGTELSCLLYTSDAADE